MRILGIAITLYGLALLFICSKLAPGLTYPHTAEEWRVAELLVAGVVLTIGGTAMFSFGGARR